MSLKAGGGPDDPGYGIEDAAQHGRLAFGDGRSETVVTEPGDYRRFYAGVGQAIAAGGEPPVTAADAILGLRIIELARRSAREGRRIGL